MSEEKEREILINRMYSGYDLDEMLGHEAINLIPDDNGNWYLYVLSNGAYAHTHFDKLEEILIVRGVTENCYQLLYRITEFDCVLENHITDVASDYVHNKKNKKEIKSVLSDRYVVEYGAMSKQKKLSTKERHFREKLFDVQKKYIRDKEIKYGKIYLDEIYKNNHIDKKKLAIYITFKVKKMQKPKGNKKVYLVKNGVNLNLDGEKIILDDLKYSQHKFRGFLNSKKDDESYVQLIRELNLKCEDIKEKITYEDFIKKQKVVSEDKYFMKPSILEFMQQTDSETIYSNMIVNVLKKYPNICRDFLKEITKNGSSTVTNDKNIVIDKEVAFKSNEANKKGEGRIDILIREGNNIYVIENKIKSNLNGIEKDKNNKISKTQLDKYCAYVTSKYPNYNYRYFVFSPVYNFIKDSLLEKNNKTGILYKYILITYKDLYNFFKNEKYKFILEDDPYYKEFVYDLSIHAKPLDEYHFDLMMRKFSAAIERARSKDK